MYWCHITLAIAAVPERNQKWRCAVDTHSSYLVSALRHVDTSRTLPCVWFCSTGFYASWNIERQIICEMSDFKVINVIILSMNSSWFRSPTFLLVYKSEICFKKEKKCVSFIAKYLNSLDQETEEITLSEVNSSKLLTKLTLTMFVIC